MTDDDDMIVMGVFTRDAHCEVCKLNTPHRVVAYMRSEFRECLNCHKHIEVFYKGSRMTGLTDLTEDKSRTDYYNEKDKVQRTYQPRVSYKKRKKRRKKGE